VDPKSSLTQGLKSLFTGSSSSKFPIKKSLAFRNLRLERQNELNQYQQVEELAGKARREEQ
jgi:hypothetical protein